MNGAPRKGSELSLTGLISRHADARPDALAAVCRDRKLTYGQLQSQGSRLALALHARGIRRGDRVVVLSTRCLEMLVLSYAVLKVGACYIPLDLDSLGKSRIEHVVESLQPALAVTTGPFSKLACPVLSWTEADKAINGGFAQIENGLSGCEIEGLRPNDLAYIVFTSGTTSNPKGVMIPSSALLNYVQQGDPKSPFNMGVTFSDKVLLIFSPAFDGISPNFRSKCTISDKNQLV
jgi:gliotoxin/aspirochlorine biosynthesis peptide synthetase